MYICINTLIHIHWIPKMGYSIHLTGVYLQVFFATSTCRDALEVGKRLAGGFKHFSFFPIFHKSTRSRRVKIGCSCLWGCFSIHILSVDQSSKQFWFIDKYNQISTSLPPLICLLDFLKPINNPWNISIVLHLSLNFILFSFISRWNTPTRLSSKSKTHEISPLLLYYILHGWFNPFLYGLNQHFTSHIHVKIYI